MGLGGLFLVDTANRAGRSAAAGGRLRRLLQGTPLLLVAALTACVGRPADVEEVQIESQSFGFIGELLSGETGSPQRVGATLVLPEGEVRQPPFPALVLLHTSNGQGAQDWLYAKRLSALGIAVLAVDSFSSRGVSRTVRDQTLVSTASMLADAYGGLDALAADPRIDPAHIGVMGFSKGGIAALYAAYRPVQEKASRHGRAFALHVAYYPWCGLRLREPETTGAPVLIQTGALDDLVPPRRCRELIAISRSPAGAPGMHLVVLPEARHAFDHPMLSWFGNLPISAPSPAYCELRQRADGHFVETHSGKTVDGGNLKEVLAPCSRKGHAGGNETAAAQALSNTLAFLQAEGFLPQDKPAP